MPASPVSKTTRPSPSTACCQRSNSSASSASRPTSGVTLVPYRAEAAFGIAGPEHAPSPNGIGKAGKRYIPEIQIVEQPAAQPLCCARNHDGVRLRQVLQSGGKVWRLAD